MDIEELKEKVIDYATRFINHQREKYGFWFYFCAFFAVLGGIGLVLESPILGILLFIPFIVFGYYMMLLVLWMWAMIFKLFGKTVKFAGKTAVAAGGAAIGVGAAATASKRRSGGSSSSDSSGNRPRQVNRVYRMKYNGQGRSGPDYLDVPSAQSASTARPSRDEIIAALEDIGYSHQDAKDLANGGSTHDWEVVG